jgi:type IV pilus assembly protein PilA
MRLKRARRGFTLIELLIVMAIILVIAAIAVPQLGKQLMAAHENAVVQTIRNLHADEAQYYAQFQTYATSLTQLGPPASGAAGPAAADLIPKGLAEGHSSGYIFSISGSPTGYVITAVPETYGNSGSRTFFSDQTMVIRNNFSQEPATASSPALGTQVGTTGATSAPAAAPAAAPAPAN